MNPASRMEKGLTVQEDLRFRQSSLSILVFICNNIYRGGLPVWKIEGDFHSAVGFPAALFFKLLDLMVEKWFTGVQPLPTRLDQTLI